MAAAPRAAIEARAGELERQLADGVVSGRQRTEARTELMILQRRLSEGDLRTGDQMVISLLGDTITADTATVRDGALVSFAGLPDVSVAGALQSDVRERLQAHVDRFYKNVTVRVNLLTRLGVLGEVLRPGFYSVPPDRPVTELVMLAGGPTPLTNLGKVSVRRNGREVLDGKAWDRAQKAGLTVAQLGLRPGDEVEFGRKRQFSWAQFSQIALVAVAAFAAIVQILVLIYAEPA